MKPILPSVFLSPDAVQTRTAKLMGRQSAGRGFMRGLADAYRDDDRPLVLEMSIVIGRPSGVVPNVVQRTAFARGRRCA